jgi:hypothetical protein
MDLGLLARFGDFMLTIHLSIPLPLIGIGILLGFILKQVA